jgi:hypothetical protein
MKPTPTVRAPADPFETVRTVGLALPDVEAATKYDGSPLLKAGGSFMAGLATHRSAEPETLVVRVGLEERDWLLEDAPGTYYVTDYYRRYPVVLVRLSRIDRDALRDLLSGSRRLALAKARPRGQRVRSFLPLLLCVFAVGAHEWVLPARVIASGLEPNVRAPSSSPAPAQQPDTSALKAARKWRFAPGRHLGKPVPVLVTIEMTFTLK